MSDETLVPLFKKELTFKFLVIGDYGVGKTCIVNRYTEGTFSSTYKITIGADFSLRTLEWDDQTNITIQLWDIAGHARFGTLTSVYYRYALGAAVVFDLTRPDTYNSIEKWILDLRRKVCLMDGQEIPVVLLANKGDVTVETVPNDINELCSRHNIIAWLVTSAKEGVNIEEAIRKLTQTTLNYLKTGGKNRISAPIKLSETTPKKKRFCFI